MEQRPFMGQESLQKYNRQRPIRVRESAWRKISINSWRLTGDSSVYAELDLDVTSLEAWCADHSLKIFTVLCRILALSLKRNPEFNRFLRSGKLYQRHSVDLFVLSSLHAASGEDDLTGVLVSQSDCSEFEAFLAEYQRCMEALKKGDSPVRQVKSALRFVPSWLLRKALNGSGLVFNLVTRWSRLMGLDDDPWGSATVTNVGSVGVDFIYSPIARYSQVSLVISVGMIQDGVKVDGGKVLACRRARLGFVVDHRVCDGKHIGSLFRVIREMVATPDLLVKNQDSSSGHPIFL